MEKCIYTCPPPSKDLLVAMRRLMMSWELQDGVYGHHRNQHMIIEGKDFQLWPRSPEKGEKLSWSSVATDLNQLYHCNNPKDESHGPSGLFNTEVLRGWHTQKL